MRVHRMVSILLLVGVSFLTGGCTGAKMRPMTAALADPAPGDISAITRIVLEDPNGTLLGYGNLLGIARDFTTRTMIGGIEVVSGFPSSRIEEEVRGVLNSILGQLGYPPLRLGKFRRALRGNRLTCHEVMHDRHGRFRGVATQTCGRALVFGVEPWDEGIPLAHQIGFWDPGSGSTRGGLPEEILRRADSLPSEASPNPEEVSWRKIRELLEAAIKREDAPNSAGESWETERPFTFSICVKNMEERLGSLGERRPFAEKVIPALRAFWRSEEGRFLTRHKWEDAEFPAGIFDEPCIPQALAPYLGEEGIVLLPDPELDAKCNVFLNAAESGG